MKNFYITRHDNGAGLGDAMMQVNFFYRLAENFNLNYVHTPFVSASHASSYDSLLGLVDFPIKKDSFDIRQSVSIDEFLDLFNSNLLSEEILYEVVYDYGRSSYFFESLRLVEYKYFPWLEYFHGDRSDRNIDVLIHLRFGDSFCYPLSNNYYFDARHRKILQQKDLVDRYKWDLHNFRNVLEANVNLDNDLCVISDGIDSGIRTLKWTDYGKGFPVNYVEDVILNLWNEAKKIALEYNLNIGVGDLASDVNKIINAKSIVASEGGFVRQINHFLRSAPAPVTDIRIY